MTLDRRLAFLLPLALLLSGCAVAGFQPVASNQPIERQALAPEYRIFYDALEDQGRWTLIEPWGYVFKPDVNFVAWSPYQNGFWVPSDVYGWVWISNEPFGWAVYHYGQWAWDDFQGWVWIPGLDWGPGWVTWEATASYVGWAPLLPSNTNPANIPGGPWRWAPMSAMGNPSLAERIQTRAQAGGMIADARPVRNPETREGVTFDRGPAFEVVEKIAGPLPRVRLDAVDPLAIGRDRRDGSADRERGPRESGVATDPEGFKAQIEATKRAADEAARRAAALGRASGPVSGEVQVVRPGFGAADRDAPTGRSPAPGVKRAPGDRDAAKPAGRRPARGAAADTSARK